MIHYRECDISCMEGFNSIIKALGLSEVTDQEVWETARVSTSLEIPCFENILLSITLDRICTQLASVGIDEKKMSWDANCACSNLCVFEENVYSIEDLEAVLKENHIEFKRVA